VYRLNPRACESDLREAELRLGLELPAQVRTLWAEVNGLTVDDPLLRLLPLSEFTVQAGLLMFAECDGTVQIAFDTNSINEAGQWSIVNADTGYRITYTVASFWSVHMWNWLLKRRPFWFDVHRSIATPN
jgi:hypothetical protein